VNARYRVLDPRNPRVVWMEATTRYWAESKIACLGEPGVQYVIVDLDAAPVQLELELGKDLER
jgi:hypothetical protein